MEYRVQLEERAEGGWTASCAEPAASVHGLSPDNALDRLRAELRYRVELCPCSGVGDDEIRLRVGG